MFNIKKNITYIFVFLCVFSFNTIAEESFNQDEKYFISYLSDVSAFASVEQNCFGWDENTQSNIQTFFIRGVHSVLNERLGNRRFIKYVKASLETPSYWAKSTITLLNGWRKSDQPQGVKTYCNEDLPYKRTTLANGLLSIANRLTE
jgi:hypothetical protein